MGMILFVILTSFLFRFEDMKRDLAKPCQPIETRFRLFLGNIKAGALRDDALAFGDELRGEGGHGRNTELPASIVSIPRAGFFANGSRVGV